MKLKIVDNSGINELKLKYIERDISNYANIAELDYRESQQLLDEKYDSLEKWLIRYTNDGRLEYSRWILQDVKPYGTVCELGAGGCWLAATLSTLPFVKHVYAVEISRTLLTQIAPSIIKTFGAIIEKMTLVRGDFFSTGFDRSFFDFIFFDASLHHVNNYVKIFTELKRILKPTGKIIAIREPILLPLRRGFKEDHVEPGHPEVTENIFTVKEWKKLCKNNGFVLKIVPKPIKIKILDPLKELIIQISPLREKDYKGRFINFCIRIINRLILRRVTSWKNRLFGFSNDIFECHKCYFLIRPSKD